MLKIQVLGKGLIPRGYGLAPRKEFFKADLNLIQTILMTPGLKVNMLNPEDDKIIAVTNANVKRLWERYRSDIPTRKVVAGGITAPVAPVKPTNDLDLGSKLEKHTPQQGISTPTDTIKEKVNEAINPPAAPVPPVKPVEEPKVENTVMPNVTTEKDTKPEEKVEDHKDETPDEKDTADASAETPTPAIKPVLNNNNNNNKNHNNNHNQNKK